MRNVLISPPPGGGRSVREANRVGVNGEREFHPTPARNDAPTLPLQGRVSERP